MGIDYDQETLAAAEVCFSLALQLLYSEPDDEVIAEQIADRMFLEAPFGMENADVRKGLASMDAWCKEAACDPDGQTERVAALKREWFRLFIGAGTPDAPCWESFYLDPNSQLFGVRTLEVRAWYKRYGLQVERLHAEPDDHLGLMLGFVSRMIACEAEALRAGDVAAAGKAACDQEMFLTEQMLPWLPVWRYRAVNAAVSGYFQGAADLVFGLCVCYARRFGIVYDEASSSFKKTRGC